MSDFSSCRSKKLSTTEIKITSSQKKTFINIIAIFFIVKLNKFFLFRCAISNGFVSISMLYDNCNFSTYIICAYKPFYFLCNQFNKCLKTWNSLVSHIFSTILVKVYISLSYGNSLFIILLLHFGVEK